MNINQLFLSGGAFMWPLLILSVFAVSLTLERAVSLIIFNLRFRKFLGFLKTREGTVRGFSKISASIFTMPKEEAGKLLEEDLQLVFDRLAMPQQLLAGLAGVAPLLGFIGTVSGMINTFQSISGAEKVTVQLVAGGISEALITTGFGLIIAVICILVDSLCRFYITTASHRVEEEVTKMLRLDEAESGTAN